MSERTDDADDPREPWICVVAPTSILMVELERTEGSAARGGPGAADGPDAGDSEDGGDDLTTEVHVHPGGQGLWVASMASSLGARVSVCGPFGGEAGSILTQLATAEGLEVTAVPYAGGSAAWVHDRRSGRRVEIATMPAKPLRRHEVDEFFGAALVAGSEADVCVLTGTQPADVLSPSFYSRLAHDLHVAGGRVVADLAQEAAVGVAAEGPELLKMAHDEVVDAGIADDDSVEGLRRGANGLVEQGVGTMVVSRAGEPTLVVGREGAWLVRTPPLSPVDHRGAGDSMTAGMAVALGRGAPVLEAVRLGAAAGTLNVTRRGLGTGRRAQIERFAAQVEVEELD